MSAASIIHTYIYASHTINPSVFAICVYTHVYLCVHTLCIRTSVCARVRLTHSNPQTACMLQCAHLTYGCVYLSVYLLPCICVSMCPMCLSASVSIRGLYVYLYACYVCIFVRVICVSICVLCVYLCACDMCIYVCIYMRVIRHKEKQLTKIHTRKCMNSFDTILSASPYLCVPCVSPVCYLTHCSRSFPSTPHQETLHYTKEAAASVCTLLKGWVKAV